MGNHGPHVVAIVVLSYQVGWTHPQTFAALNVQPFRLLDWNVTVQEWEQQYAKHNVIRPTLWKTATDFDPLPWTRLALKQHCGDNKLLRLDRKGCRTDLAMENQEACHDVSVRDPKYVGESWGGLVSADLSTLNISTVADLLNAQDAAANNNDPHIVLFDAPLRHYCPKLQQHVKVPKYFGRDYLLLKEWYKDLMKQSNHANHQAASFSLDFMAAQKKHNWPSIIVSKQGGGTFLHADGHTSRFWATQLSGRKRWRVFDVVDGHKLLHPNVTYEFYPRLFELDAFDPDFQMYPELNGTIVYEAITEPGDTILIPEGWPHQVQNLQDSVLTSGNFFDQHALRTAMKYESGFRSQLPQLYDAFFMPLEAILNDQDDNLSFTFVLLRNRYLHFEKAVPGSVVKWVDLFGECIDSDWDVLGWTPLQVAVVFDYRVVVDYLLQTGHADVRAKARDGHTTAFDLAKRFGRKELLNRLEEAQQQNECSAFLQKQSSCA